MSRSMAHRTRDVAATLLVSFAVALQSHTTAVAATLSAVAESERETLAGGAWHPGTFVPCADGVVTFVGPRLDEPAIDGVQHFASGVGVEMRLPTAPKFLGGKPFRRARVVHYGGDNSNTLMQAEKAGDRVQVCLVSFPTPTHDPQTGKVICDPNVDSRGMVYRVYDYKQHAAFMGPDSQHSCGGA